VAETRTIEITSILTQSRRSCVAHQQLQNTGNQTMSYLDDWYAAVARNVTSTSSNKRFFHKGCVQQNV
jgi:hypothetical protein